MSSKRISEPYLSFNKNNFIFKQLNVKEIILNFIYKNIDMKKINEYVLNQSTLGLIDSMDYIVEPYINGIPCLCVIMRNKNNYYSCLVKKEGLTADKKDLIINNVKIFNFDVKFSNRRIYNGTILEGIYKYESEANTKEGNEEFFIVNDVYYLNGENMINVKINNKFSNLNAYLNNFVMGKFNIFINNYLTFENPDKIANMLDDVVIKNSNMKLNIKQSVNGYRFYSSKTGKILNFCYSNNGQKINAKDIDRFNDIKFTYAKQKVKEEGKVLTFFCVNDKELCLAEPIEYSTTEAKTKCKPIKICDIEKNEIENMISSKYKYLDCRITNEGIIPFKYSLQKKPNKLSELVELLEF